jgi:hypothetical protein
MNWTANKPQEEGSTTRAEYEKSTERKFHPNVPSPETGKGVQVKIAE